MIVCVKDLFDDLISSRLQLKSAIFDEFGKARDYALLMKNRKDIDSMDGLDTTLNDGDELAIIPPIAGG